LEFFEPMELLEVFRFNLAGAVSSGGAS